MNKFEPGITTHRVGMEGRESVENFRARRGAFRALHEAGCFVIPNPWDVGSARYLQQLGFPALATTSAGFAFSQGLPDSEGALTCERNLAYISDIAEAVDVPVNADFASGYGASPQDVVDNVTRCIAAGVALSETIRAICAGLNFGNRSAAFGVLERSVECADSVTYDSLWTTNVSGTSTRTTSPSGSPMKGF
jgi:Phosphoenolpyruvate phosphomutase